MRALALLLAACTSSVEPSGRAADVVVDAPGHTGTGFYDSDKAVNGVRGAGESMGSTDVYTIGFEADDYLVLGWSGARIADGPGADFVVFENAFRVGETTRHFIDAVIVEVSSDGSEWIPMPHDYVAPDETMYSLEPSDWIGFAGVTPVRYNVDSNAIDPFSPEAGGDRFDLADVALSSIAFVRLVSAGSRTNPDTGVPYPHHPISDGADIDGVVARYFTEQ